MTTSTDSLPALLRETALSSSSKVILPDNLEDTTSSAYSHLLGFTSQSLQTLREQPAALQASRGSLELQLSTLCSRHVHSFVRVRTATAALPSAMDKLDEQLETLIERDLPALANASQSFSKEVGGTIAAKERARNLLEQYDLSIQDLLDIPRLLMTCARASHPIEALQLGIHMARTVEAERRTKNSKKRTLLLVALKEECWTHLLRLRSDLLRDLGARGVRLPAARRYVSLLSRLQQVDEAGHYAEADEESTQIALSPSTICLSFLQSRWAVVEEIGAHETDDDLTTQTYAQISTWRDVVGESCSIALALFGDGKASAARPEDEVTPLSLISSFASLCLGKLEELVRRQLPRIGVSASSLHDAFESLDTLHTQMAYAASSLSRQGLDFSQVSQCAALFEQQALLYWTQGLAKVKERFNTALQPQTSHDLSSVFGTNEIYPLLQHPILETSHSPWSEEAARFLLLARLANDLLDAYEALLIFAPLSIGQGALAILDEALEELVSGLASFVRRIEDDKVESGSQLHLPSITRSQTAETDAARVHQASLAVCARFASAMCRSVLPSVRTFVADAFQTQMPASPAFNGVVEELMSWSVRMDSDWRSSEQTRVKQAEEASRRRIAQEEERKRLEEEQRVKEEEERRRRQEEQVRIEAEQAEQRAKEAAIRAKEEARRRQEEAERRQEEERARKEAAEEEQRRLVKEMERKRKEEAEEAAAAERAAQEQAERNRLKEEEEKERQRREEEEAAAARKLEEEEAAAAAAAAASRKQEDEERAKVVAAERKRQEEQQAMATAQKQREEEEELRQQREIAEMEENSRLQREQDLAREEEEERKKSEAVEKEKGEEPPDATRAPVAEVAPQRMTLQEGNGNMATSQEEADALGAPPTSTAESSTDLPTSTQTEQAQTEEAPPVVRTQPRPANKLAEKLRKRQEERERAAAAARAKAEKGD